MPLRVSRNWILPAAVLLAMGTPLRAQESGVATSGVFRRYADRVIKIHVTETGSAAKSSLGSGFFVSPDGHIVTNYHVIASLIQDPERYRAGMVDVAGVEQPLELLAVDVVHDLAVMRAKQPPKTWFTIGQARVTQGDRLYALGHPRDLGLSIVEGTYNGHLRHTLYPKIHFTGSLNSGMSGGPTISDDGRVVGVNVSTAGNQLSFLVPVERAEALLRSVLAPGATPAARTLEDVGRQLREYQDLYLEDMFAGETKTVELGPYRVVTEPMPFFRCWADARRREDMPYEHVHHQCSTDDYLFVAGDQTAGVVELDHQLISSKSLNAARFFSLYSSIFGSDNTPAGEEEHVTSWRCGTRNVRNQATPMRAVLCLRRYRKLGELYDAVLKVAVLGRPDTGLVSTLTLSGVSFENVDRLSRRYLERITWH